jgi:hypothetical protein
LTNEMAEQAAVDTAAIEHYQGELRHIAETAAIAQQKHAALIEQLKQEYSNDSERPTGKEKVESSSRPARFQRKRLGVAGLLLLPDLFPARSLAQNIPLGY